MELTTGTPFSLRAAVSGAAEQWTINTALRVASVAPIAAAVAFLTIPGLLAEALAPGWGPTRIAAVATALGLAAWLAAGFFAHPLKVARWFIESFGRAASLAAFAFASYLATTVLLPGVVEMARELLTFGV